MFFNLCSRATKGRKLAKIFGKWVKGSLNQFAVDRWGLFGKLVKEKTECAVKVHFDILISVMMKRAFFDGYLSSFF